MFMKKIFLVILTLFSLMTFAQDIDSEQAFKNINNDTLLNLLVGKWNFTRAIDSVGNEARFQVLSKPRTVGVIASDIEFHPNKTYQEELRINPGSVTYGTWKILPKNLIEYTVNKGKHKSVKIYYQEIVDLDSTALKVKSDENLYLIYHKLD